MLSLLLEASFLNSTSHIYPGSITTFVLHQALFSHQFLKGRRFSNDLHLAFFSLYLPVLNTASLSPASVTIRTQAELSSWPPSCVRLTWRPLNSAWPLQTHHFSNHVTSSAWSLKVSYQDHFPLNSGLKPEHHMRLSSHSPSYQNDCHILFILVLPGPQTLHPSHGCPCQSHAHSSILPPIPVANFSFSNVVHI